MRKSVWLPAIVVLALGSGPLWAASYSVNCGTGGPSSLVQADLNAIGSSPQNTVSVTGTCVGDLVITGATQLTLSGLVLTGNLPIDSSTLVSLGNLQSNGPTASSTLAGPVRVTGNATVDTDNSATVVNVATSCTLP
jgi:hypothetical protein